MRLKRILIILSIITFFSFALYPIAHAGAWALSSIRWLDKDEKVYESFVQSIGDSGQGNIDKFIRDPQANPLYTEEDKRITLSPDCADFPYLIRAYVAYKLRLPFSYVSEVNSRGGDPRYGSKITPSQIFDQDHYSSFQQLVNAVKLVHSGYYRMAPEVENGDTYPVKIQKETIIPGTIYYDPNGHVTLVYKVSNDGRIRFVDSHPDRTLSRPWFGPKFALGSRSNGGGFRRWRPIWYSNDGKTMRLSNINLPDFSAEDQYSKVFHFNGIGCLSYYEYIRMKLSNSGGIVEPFEEFQFMISDIYEDIKYRGVAVNNCVMRGISKKPHPGNLPWNIYGTDGEWEEYSTPSRDARLKAAFRDMFERTVKMVSMAENRDPHLRYSGSPNKLVAG
ncbi:hypothetical protein HYY75_02815, partial [bacterium]|nr:hypothetical protein [bacterium]